MPDRPAQNEEVCRPGNGIAGSPLPPCFNTGRGIQVFSQYDDGSSTGYRVSPTFTERRLVEHRPKRPTWHSCSAFAFEVERVQAGALSQLTASQIESQGAQNSRLRWRLEWGGSGGGQVRTMDIGEGTCVSVFSCSVVSIYALYPEGAHVGRTTETLSGRVLDTLVGAEIVESEHAMQGQSRGRLTQVIEQDAVNAQLILIPPGARKVYATSTADINALGWAVGAGPIAGGTSITGLWRVQSPAVVETSVPGSARNVYVPPGAGVLTLIWELDI